MSHKISWYLLVVIIALFTKTTTYSQGNDAAFWTGIELEKTIKKGLDGHLKFQGRLNDNFTHLDYGFIDFGIDYKLNKYISATTAYVLNSKNSPMGRDWSARHQWYGNIKLSYKHDKFKVVNRNQLQTDLEDSRSASGSWFYRNKTSVKIPINKEFSTNFSYEAYFRLGFREPHEGVIYRTRYAFGIGYQFNKRNQLNLGYLIQLQRKSAIPDRIFAVTVGYDFAFRGKLIESKKKNSTGKTIVKDK